MSRLGKIPVKVPSGVELQLAGDTLTVKGTKGTLQLKLVDGIGVTVEKNEAVVTVDASKDVEKPMHGLYRSLLQNYVIGVSAGFEKKLKLIGVGYRAILKGSQLELQLGYSHPCELPVPAGIQVKIDNSTDITLTGIDKKEIGQFAANIRAIRPPEPYKGKGVRYVGEYVRKKAGKAAKGK